MRACLKEYVTMTKKISPLTGLKERLHDKGLLLDIISRVQLEKVGGGMFNRKTLANHDSEGVGPRRKIKGPRGLVSYYVEDVLEYAEKRYHVEEDDD